MNLNEKEFTLLDNMVETYQTTKDEKKKRYAHLKIVELSMLMVRKLVNSISQKTDLSKEDLIQVGALGLVKAIEFYNSEKNNKFLTYATHIVRGEIKHYLRDKGSIIRTPRELQTILYKISLAIKKLKESGYNDPSNEQIAEISNIDIKKINEALQTEYNTNPLSLDQSVFSNDNTTEDESSLLDKIPSGDYLEELNYYDERITLTQAIERLPEELKQIIKMNYYDDMSQREIGKKLNISQMQVSRKIKRALNKLYEILQAPNYNSILEEPLKIKE